MLTFPRLACLACLALALPLSGVAAEPEPVPPPAEEVPPLVKEPVLLQFIQAPYPQAALDALMEGTVGLEIEIDATGKVTRAEVIRPAGFGFDEAAREATLQFQFSPAEDATGPVPVIIEFEYGFVQDAASRDDAVPQAPAPGDSADALAPINLDGEVVEMGTRRSLIGFAVLLTDLEGFQVATDASGRFAFRGVPLGSHHLRALLPGFDPIEKDIEITAGEAVSLKLWARNQSYRENELVGVYRREQEEITRRTLTMQEVRRVPGTFGDPVRVIQSLPGAARTPFGTGLLIIRGANPEDTGVYIDGIRVPIIYHLGGIVSIINADLVEAVDYLPGGFGARYGRNMGGVVDVITKHTYPEPGRITWSTDILDSGGLVEGRAGKNDQWGFAAGGRQSYIELFIPLFTKNSKFVIKPRWMDYQAKVDRLDMENGKFSVFVFGFVDTLKASTPASVAQGTDQDTQGDLVTGYSTHRMLVNWEHSLSDALSLRLTPSIGYDGGQFGLGAEFQGSTDTWITEIRAELPWKPSEHFALTPGLDLAFGPFGFSVTTPFNPEMGANYDPLAEREPWTIEDKGFGWGPDLYASADIRPLDDPERLLLTPGVRLDYANLSSGFEGAAWDPRFAGRYRFGPKISVKGSAGIYNQTPMPYEAYRPDGKVDIDYERAWSGTLGTEWSPAQGFTLEAEGFYKWLDRQLVMNEAFTSLDDAYFLNDGFGRVYGTEFLIRRDPIGRFYGWLSYTLSKSERKSAANDDWYDFEFDQTHILVLLAGYRLPYDFDVSARGQYVTGNPTTPYAGGVYDIDQNYYIPYQTAAYDSERLPPYWNVDLRVEKLFTFRRWQMSTYLDLMNVLRGENPEFVTYNYDYTESGYIRGLPFLVNPGVDLEFRF